MFHYFLKILRILMYHWIQMFLIHLMFLFDQKFQMYQKLHL
jgi:hypothetical protein